MMPLGRSPFFLYAVFLGFFFLPPDSRALAAPADAGIEEHLNPAAAARRFLDAYPDFLVGYDTGKKELVGWDGARFPVDGGKEKNDCQDKAAPPLCCPSPSLTATLRIRYRPVAEHWPTPDDPPLPDEDAGRLRPLALLAYMYGAPAAKNADGSWQTRKVGDRVELVGGGVEKNLAPVAWKLAAKEAKIRVSRVNGVNRQLAAVVAELEKISAEAKSRYGRLHSGGKTGVSGFYPRLVRGSDCEISPHTFGVAVDIHWRPGLDYWLDSPPGDGYRYRSVMPEEIVAVFERHGFIWGGKWRHFDGMHFEYRPELLGLTMPPAGHPVGKPAAKPARKPSLDRSGAGRQLTRLPMQSDTGKGNNTKQQL